MLSWQFNRPITNFSNDISWVGPNAWLGKGRPECMPWKFSWHLGFPKKSLAYLPLTTTEEFPSALGIKALFTKYCWYSQSCKPLQSRVQYKPVRKHSLTEKAQKLLGLTKKEIKFICGKIMFFPTIFLQCKWSCFVAFSFISQPQIVVLFKKGSSWQKLYCYESYAILIAFVSIHNCVSIFNA